MSNYVLQLRVLKISHSEWNSRKLQCKSVEYQESSKSVERIRRYTRNL